MMNTIFEEIKKNIEEDRKQERRTGRKSCSTAYQKLAQISIYSFGFKYKNYDTAIGYQIYYTLSSSNTYYNFTIKTLVSKYK